MNHVQRIACVLAGRVPDRPPVSFWHHFAPDQYSGRAAVEAHLDHLHAFDLDFLKVMNDNGYPHPGHLETAADLASLQECRGDEDEFARQLDLLAELKSQLHGQVLLTTTIFNSWSVLRNLIRPPKVHRPPNLDAGATDEPSAQIRAWAAQDPQAAHGALRRIGASLANFARRCLGAGADGVFLSVRDDWVRGGDTGSDGLYQQMVRPTDLAILHAAEGGVFNLLHVCGRAVDFRSFAGYPVHAVNWADRAAGPSIAQVRDWLQPVLCAGVDNLTALPDGTPQDCAQQVADALRQAGDRPIILAPGCTYDPARVPRENLQAVCAAARGVPSSVSGGTAAPPASWPAPPA
jgi:uroporphyrinogen decarboxylase